MAKKRDIFSRYKTYEGERGSASQWRAQAQAIVAHKGRDVGKSLAALGLTGMPTSLADLQKARRKAMVTAHPDKGGTQEQAVAINQAFTHLSEVLAAQSPISVRPTAPQAASSAAAQSLTLISPPRCTWELPEDLDNPDLIGDLKIDGERLVLYLNSNPYTGAAETTLLTRYIGKHTKRYGDRTQAHPDIAYPYEGLDGTILDCELFQGMLYAFDIPFYKGRDIRQLPLRERREILKKALQEMGNSQVQLIPSWSGDLMTKFQTVVAQGGEGLVVKHLDAPYGECWAKLKKSYDVSCVVTNLNDTEKGQGSFSIAVYDGGKLVEVGKCNGGDASFIGRVVDVFAQELTVHGRIRHASFHRFRDDIDPKECTMAKLKDDFKKKARADRIKERG